MATLSLRMRDNLKAKAKQLASQQDVSLNSYINATLAVQTPRSGNAVSGWIGNGGQLVQSFVMVAVCSNDATPRVCMRRFGATARKAACQLFGNIVGSCDALRARTPFGKRVLLVALSFAFALSLVIWVSNPYFATGVNEVPIQPDGTYQLPNLAPGKYPITVLAPGFAPEQREVDLSHGTQPCDFQLEPGHPIRIEIVDTTGNPIPNTAVSFEQDGWRGTSAIYNNDHSGVPDSGIPRRADENGVYVWDWAPSDGVTYSIYKEGYDSKTVTLMAKEMLIGLSLLPQ